MPEFTAALVGNPNVGKTAFFNAITGAHQHVANWPGVTVEKKTGVLKWRDYTVNVVDLPGIYTLRARSLDERVSCDFLLKEKPDVVFNVVDATNLKRNLYLSMQLMEMDVKTVLILNQMDEVRNLNIDIDVSELSKRLGLKVVTTIAKRGVNIDEVMEAAMVPSPAVRYEIYPKELESALFTLEKAARENERLDGIPSRWLGVAFAEGDELAGEVARDAGIGDYAKELFGLGGQNMMLSIARSRYEFIEAIVKQIEKRPAENWTLTDALDHVFTHKVLGLPIFAAIMWMMFQFAFSASLPLSDLMQNGFDALAARVGGIHGWFGSLVGNGLISGVGSVLVFVPLIFFLFLSMGILEDSGYMSRAAFLIDKVMHKFKLSGKAFIPMILGFGCNASAIMTTRIIESEKERLISILINPFTSCSARLPIYAMLSAVFFGRFAGLTIFSLYIISIVFALIMAVILSYVLRTKESSPLVMEMPRYQSPTAKGLGIYTWGKGKHFLKKAGGIIAGATVAVWLLSNLPAGTAVGNSFAADIGKALAPLLAPLHFDWHIALSLIFGGIAKEVTVTTLGTFAGGNLHAFLPTILNPIDAYGLMLFALLYIPCAATQATMKMETGTYKWPIFSVVWSLGIAYAVTLAFETVARLAVGA